MKPREGDAREKEESRTVDPRGRDSGWKSRSGLRARGTVGMRGAGRGQGARGGERRRWRDGRCGPWGRGWGRV